MSGPAKQPPPRVGGLMPGPDLSMEAAKKKPMFAPNLAKVGTPKLPSAPPKHPPAPRGSQRPPRHEQKPTPVHHLHNKATSIVPAAPVVAPQPPRVRKSRTYEADTIAPTAKTMQVDPLNANHPITLPFMDPSAKSNNPPIDAMDVVKIDDAIDLDSYEQRPSSSSISAPINVDALADEQPRATPLPTPIDMFKDDTGRFSGEDQMFFIQLPASLPLGITEESFDSSLTFQQNQLELLGGSEGEKKNYESLEADVLGYKSPLHALKDGKVGKLILYKSGKVKLKIGDFLFDVATGLKTNFLQEVAVISPEEERMYHLGELTHRMVCSPDLDGML